MASSSDSRSCNCADPLVEQVEDPVGREHAHQREAGLELGELLGRGAEQLRHPLVDLGAAVVGDAVDGAFGAAPFPHHLLLLDQPPLEQGLDHPVERAVVEADAGVLPPRAHGGGHLVGMHRALGETRQHGEGERVAAATSPSCTSFLVEYSDQSIRMRVPAQPPNRAFRHGGDRVALRRRRPCQRCPGRR